jgi:hypothetical protein
MKEKYVLCVPKGCGFNDVLCQIQDAYQFSVKTNRTLLIDTRISGLADSFSYYFDLKIKTERIKLDINNELIETLNSLTCYPKEFEGKIDWMYDRFYAIYSQKLNNWKYLRPIQTFIRLITYVYKNENFQTFSSKINFIKHYLSIRKLNFYIKFEELESNSEDLIIHHMTGGGEQSVETLSMLKFKPDIIKKIKLKTFFLGENFDAIHIRNTDYLSDYSRFFQQIKLKLTGRRIFLCSDNIEVIYAAKEIFQLSEILHIEKQVPETRNGPIHFQWGLPFEKIQINNITLLADLVGMANSSNLYFPPLSENIYQTKFSGFSLLANNLKFRQDILQQLLTE